MNLDLNQLGQAVKSLPIFAMDSASGLFAANLTLVTLNEVFKHEYPATHWASGELCTISTAVDEGARAVGYTELKGIGRAGIVAENATDIPETDVEGEYHSHRVRTIAASFSWTTQDVRTARMQGGLAGMTDAIAEKAMNCREAHDWSFNDYIRDGDASLGLPGYTNSKGIFVIQAQTTDWMTATAAQITSSFSAAISYGKTQTESREIPDTAVFPTDVFGRIKDLQNSTASDATVLEFLKRTNPEITKWADDSGMNTAGTGKTKAVLIYNRAPNKSRVSAPMLMRPQQAQAHGLKWKVILESRFAGVLTPKPRSRMRLEGV